MRSSAKTADRDALSSHGKWRYSMKKRIFLAIVLIISVAGILSGIKYFQFDRMTAQ